MIDEDTHTDVLDSQPYIVGKRNTYRVGNAQEYSSDVGDEGKLIYKRSKSQSSIAALRSKL